jgi:hypothetical protein
MSCEIIQFSAAARPARKVTYKPAAAEGTAIGDGVLTPRQLRRAGKPELPPPATETAKNSRIRIARRDAWWRAGRVTDYWRARMDWQSALETAQRWEIADSASLPLPGNVTRFELVDKWREAVVKQLLTPAPDGAAVAWKRAKLVGRDFSHLPTKAERVEQVIADDVAFLAASPVRRTHSSEAMARRREFKEAMRRRIRDIAASRDLSDEEITPALTLKHQEIWNFSQQHGVNIEWLLEGKGRIFEKDSITINPDMTGSEFVAVVRTLPTADQRSVEARIREMVMKRLDETPPSIA